jgi:hypothetical protein
MPAKPTKAEKPWKYMKAGIGRSSYDLKSFGAFDDFLREKMQLLPHFVWRGHASSDWKLESTLDRLVRKRGGTPDARIARLHLERFKFAARGRRGANPPHLDNDNDWWALGQHNGLATPLLDWTQSPYVAAYFAFYRPDAGGSTHRTIIGVSAPWFTKRSNKIRKAWKEDGRPPVVEFIRPLTDENPRLVSQGGLFSRGPDGVDLEKWVVENVESDRSQFVLVRINIPDTDRDLALRSLNRMNINHLSLFPDLYGAAAFVNLDMMVDKY